MASARDGRTSPFSPVLFLNVSGEPMRFYLRPGPSKVSLQPIITAGGGLVCGTQESNAILLADPEDITGLADKAAYFYVSTQYIRDCVEKNQQLDVDDYRFKPEQRQTRLATQKLAKSGRMGYTQQDDDAILSFLSTSKAEVKGNQIWQQMQRKGVTNHSWQSMKDRYRRYLSHKRPGADTGQQLGVMPEQSLSETHLQQPLPETDAPQTALGEDLPQPLAEIDAPQTSHETNPPQLSSNISPNKQFHVKENMKCLPEKCEKQLRSSKRAYMDVSAETNALKKGVKEAIILQDEEVEEDLSKPPNKKSGFFNRMVKEFYDSDETIDEPPESDTPGNGIRKANSAQAIQAGEGSETQSPLQANSRAEQGGAPVQRPVSGHAPSTTPVVPFESESQGEDSSLGDPVTRFTPQQLEEGKQVFRYVMRKSKKGLVDVTKALLKSSGDVSAALRYLHEGYNKETEGPLWDKHDDRLLLSSDPPKHQLIKKYGEEGVAKRIAFLKPK